MERLLIAIGLEEDNNYEFLLSDVEFSLGKLFFNEKNQSKLIDMIFSIYDFSKLLNVEK